MRVQLSELQKKLNSTVYSHVFVHMGPMLVALTVCHDFRKGVRLHGDALFALQVCHGMQSPLVQGVID